MKFALLLAISIFVSVPSFANEMTICSCYQSFNDFQGGIYEYTVKTNCPKQDDEKLKCTSQITNKMFTVYCIDTETGAHKKSETELPIWAKPVNGFTYCEFSKM